MKLPFEGYLFKKWRFTTFILINCLFLILLWFWYFPTATNAQEIIRYFDYSPKSLIAHPDNTLFVALYYELGDLEASRFLIRPRVDVGDINLFVDNKEISSQALWTSMPTLSPNKKVKLLGDFLFTKLWFEILDTQIGKVYETGSYTIWNGKLLLDYINKLNDSLLK